MGLSIITVCDIMIAVLLIASVIHGLYVGLVLKLGQIAAVISAFVVAKIFAESAGSHYDLAFLVAFIVLSVVFRRVVTVLKLVDKLPVIGPLDRIGGGICGFLIAFVLVYLLVNLVFGMVSQQVLDSWGLTEEAVRHSTLLSSFLRNTV